MDKMTHTKFNLNNFVLAISNGIDCAIEKNRNGVFYSSQRVAFIALKIASFNEFTKSNLSDILSFIILSKHNIEDAELKNFPFLDFKIFNNEVFQQILRVSEEVENNIDIENGFVVNKAFIVGKIEELIVDEVIKENFFYLGEMESFWLDLTSQRLPFFILDMLEDTTIEIEYEKLLLIAKEVSKIVYKYSHRKFNTQLYDNLSTMCKLYNFDNKDTSRILLSSYLYNIGLLKVPQKILLKNSTLDELEYDRIKAAPYYSREILSMIFGFDDIAKLASNYSERIDGSGYPYGISGNELTLKDRLLSTICIYQALSEERSYRDSFEKEEKFKILEDEQKEGTLDSSMVADLRAIL